MYINMYIKSIVRPLLYIVSSQPSHSFPIPWGEGGGGGGGDHAAFVTVVTVLANPSHVGVYRPNVFSEFLPR